MSITKRQLFAALAEHIDIATTGDFILSNPPMVRDFSQSSATAQQFIQRFKERLKESEQRVLDELVVGTTTLAEVVKQQLGEDTNDA